MIVIQILIEVREIVGVLAVIVARRIIVAASCSCSRRPEAVSM